MPLRPQADTRIKSPPINANVTHRLLCIRVIDKGMVFTKGQWGENTNHKIMIVHETKNLIEDKESSYFGKPWLLFTTLNFYYGKQGSKVPLLVGAIEKHIKRDLTEEEKGWSPGDMFDVESLIGMAVKGYIEVRGESLFPFASSWQYDTDENGSPGESWDRVSEWKPKEERTDIKPYRGNVTFTGGGSGTLPEKSLSAKEFFDQT